MLTICSICCFPVCSSCQTGINHHLKISSPRQYQSNSFKFSDQDTQWPMPVPYPAGWVGPRIDRHGGQRTAVSQGLNAVTANTGPLDNMLLWSVLKCRWFWRDAIWNLCMDPFRFRKLGKLERERQARSGVPYRESREVITDSLKLHRELQKPEWKWYMYL